MPEAVTESEFGYNISTIDWASLSARELITWRVRLHFLKRIAWLQNNWNGTARPVDWLWNAAAQDTPLNERQWYSKLSNRTVFKKALKACEKNLAKGKPQFREKLVSRFNLKAHEVDLLDYAYALNNDPHLGAQIEASLNDPSAPYEADYIFRSIFCHRELPYDILRPNSGLMTWRLIDRGSTGQFNIDPAIASYLEGALTLDGFISPYLKIQSIDPDLSFPQADSEAAKLLPLLELNQKINCRLVYRQGDVPHHFAARLCVNIGLRMMLVQMPPRLDQRAQMEIIIRAERLAILGSFAICWSDLDPAIYPYNLSLCPLLLWINEAGQTPKTDAVSSNFNRLNWVIEIMRPEGAAKTKYAKAVATQFKFDKRLSTQSIDILAEHNGLNFGDIFQVVSQMPSSENDVKKSLRKLIGRRPSDTGYIRLPERDWDDIILPENLVGIIKHVIKEARARLKPPTGINPHIRQDLSNGMPVLLYGPPGTGKTLISEIIAHRIGRNLHIVDPAMIISKYVGETAKNLTLLFQEARLSGDTLFFDEADTFFARRTEVKDANDVFNNANINTLLTLIENHPGVSILATNRFSSMEDAWKRRTRYIIEIGKPAQPERLRMWQKMASDLQVKVTGEIEGLFQELSKSYELTPAQIKNAMISAYFLALEDDLPITEETIFQGLRLEISKHGRVFSEDDINRIRRNIMRAERRAA